MHFSQLYNYRLETSIHLYNTMRVSRKLFCINIYDEFFYLIFFANLSIKLHNSSIYFLNNWVFGILISISDSTQSLGIKLLNKNPGIKLLNKGLTPEAGKVLTVQTWKYPVKSYNYCLITFLKFSNRFNCSMFNLIS